MTRTETDSGHGSRTEGADRPSQDRNQRPPGPRPRPGTSVLPVPVPVPVPLCLPSLSLSLSALLLISEGTEGPTRVDPGPGPDGWGPARSGSYCPV